MKSRIQNGLYIGQPRRKKKKKAIETVKEEQKKMKE